jgi:hypothetical protein
MRFLCRTAMIALSDYSWPIFALFDSLRTMKGTRAKSQRRHALFEHEKAMSF